MITWLKSKLRVIGITMGILLSIVGAVAYYVFLFPNYYDDPKGKVVTISRGATFRVAVDSLVSTGTIRNRWAFQLAGRLLGYTKSVKTGKYLFLSGHSNLDILIDLSLGKSRMIIPVTIPEGWRMERIVHRYERDLGIDGERMLSYCRDERFIHQHGINATSLEGFLLPETYAFYWQTEEQEIVIRMLENFKLFYTDSLLKRQEQLKKSQIEILTLASIIEAESNVSGERPVIGGVYWNRLKKGMRLEADPTVQYALGESRRLTFDDLTINSPFNTYRRSGLPPAPINNPGKSSILAALFPQEHNFLFFVATGNGGHHFAKSYGDHQKNIRQYHRVRREMQRRAG
jgi:UPF0755 protein